MDNKQYEKMSIPRKNGCREKSIISTNSYKFLSFHTLFLSTSMTLLLLPALFSCKTDTEVLTKVSGQSRSSGPLDIFIFNNDGAKHLDSYHHLETYSMEEIHLRSQNGEKQVFICANSQRDRYEWTDVNSWEALENICIELKNERREALCSTGHGIISAGNDSTYRITLRRLASEIIVQSIRCDFAGRHYEGKNISDVKVYLTNVNSRCSIAADGEITPLSIVNAGRADPDDISSFKEPDLIYRTLKEDISETSSLVDLCFLCYPNTCDVDGPGTPFTRLVIEGSIDGETFWWPIEINRKEGTYRPGIHRNTRYIYDIVIKRKGSSSPDDIVETEVADVIMNIRPWEEKEEQVIVF